MPSLVTHHMFAKEVYNNLTLEEQNKFSSKLGIYNIFSQSHDLLFYYTYNLKEYKRIKALGHIAHRRNTQKYIISIIKEILNNKEENNPELLAFLYGTITHYVLDSTCHPFIFYKTGVYRKKEIDTKKYHGEHNRMEKDLDAIYYEKYTGKKYNQCNLNKEIIGKPILSKNLVNIINKVFKENYNEDNIGTYYVKGIKHARISNFLMVNDHLGIKKSIYNWIDKITKKKYGYLGAYSTYIKSPNLKYLNLEHNSWNHPSIPTLKYNYSFEDLYDISLKKCLTIIREVNKVLYDNKDIKDILEYIPDLDYSTGLPIKKTKEMRHFEI